MLSHAIAILTTASLLLSGTAAAQERPAPADAGEGDAFRAAHRANPDVITLASGVQYRILKAGDGKTPSPNDIVICHYRGTLIDGTVFASSGNEQPVALPINRLVKGWAEALRLMPVGSKWQVVIPPDLAYGARGVRGKVGPNATVIYEVELLAAREPPGAISTAAAVSPVRTTPRPELSTITVAYKLDPRVTKSLYMGTRWVAPPTYTQVQDGQRLAVEAQAYGVDARGGVHAIAPDWRSSDPTVASIASASGNLATITVLKPGESTVEVTAMGLSARVHVKAEMRNGSLVGVLTRTE